MSTGFEKLWGLQPDEYGKVMVWDKQQKIHRSKKIYRKYLSYLKVPKFDPKIKKSYMYDGMQESIPSVFIPFLKQAWAFDLRYNSMQVNWYGPEDFIEPHGDCDAHMVDDYKILVCPLHEPFTNQRPMIFTPYDQSSPLGSFERDGHAIEIDKAINRAYRHEVRKGEGRRISFTFRMLKPCPINCL